MKRIISILLMAAMMLSLFGAALAEEAAAPAAEYIPAPAVAGPTEYLNPVFYKNENGPTIGVVYTGVILVDGLYFKDSNNNQELDPYEDWRLPVEERVADILPRLTIAQRAGLVINQMMASPTAGTYEQALNEDGTVNMSQLITITAVNANSEENLGQNSTGAILGNRSVAGVLRKNTDIKTGVLFNNAVNQVEEYAAALNGEVAIPFNILSNPMNAGYPGSNGFAAAAIGDGNYDAIKRFAELDRVVWNAKGVDEMYGPQIDLVTDPRWNRNSGTYSEIPEVTAGIATALVEGYQGTDGIQDGDVALIMKHFPGDGAAENGFESHNAAGQWRIYATEGSLEKYQLVGFQAAIDAGVAGIMPGYSRPTLDARSATQTYRGVEFNAAELGNAYNPDIIGKLLYDVMGFKGFVNTDSGIINGKAYGVDEENTTVAERYAMIIEAGSDTGANGMDYPAVREAIETGLVSQAALDRANTHRLTALFEMGRFENPYRDLEERQAASDAVAEEIAALQVELNNKSVVLLKNHEGALPLTDTSKKVYIASFTNQGEKDETVEEWKAIFEEAGYTIVRKAADADIAFLDVVPGSISNAANWMNVLDLVEDYDVPARGGSKDHSKTGDTATMTSLEDVGKIPEIAEAVHANGGVVIAALNCSSPWILSNLEPYCDGIIAQYSSSKQAQWNVLTGAYNPTGKLPITLVSCNDVIAVNDVEIDGVVYELCVSPNDVPGYDKDQYIDPEILAKVPGGSYAYFDADGNYYRSGFGLSY